MFQRAADPDEPILFGSSRRRDRAKPRLPAPFSLGDLVGLFVTTRDPVVVICMFPSLGAT